MLDREREQLKRRVQEKEEMILSNIKNILIGKLGYKRTLGNESGVSLNEEQNYHNEDQMLDVLAKFALLTMENHADGSETGMTVFASTHKDYPDDVGINDKLFITLNRRKFQIFIMSLFKKISEGKKMNGAPLEDYEKIIYRICKYFENKNTKSKRNEIVDETRKQLELI